MLRVGTSGYSYTDWKGTYYPSQIRQSDMLAFYAEDFDTVEINYTYYRMPVARTLAGLAGKVPNGFSFTLKANQVMTHERTLDPVIFKDFCHALAPLRDQGKLGCILAQFPTSFHNNDDNRAYLEGFRDRMGDIPTVVEFRHHSWAKEVVFQWLSTLELGFCCVDQPQLKTLMPPIATATSSIAYVRFHGRNAAKWWQHQQAHERYDYSYTETELAKWTTKLQTLEQQTQQVYVFANNCYKSQSVTTAQQIKALMGIEIKPESRVQLELL